MAVATRQDYDLPTPSNLLPLAAPLPALQLGEGERRNSQLYAGWYLADPHQRLSDPAKSAFESALAILKKTLTSDEYSTPWLQGQSSMRDVQDAVVRALEEYKTKSKGSKAQEWLSNCSERVIYYGAIFDTFAQHHPEYVSLAWGAMKFLFISVLNHEELLSEISKSISNLADILPRTELHSILYPTARMQEAVSLLYAKVMEFVVKAIKWCKKSKARHAISAIAHPFELKFKSIIDEITRRSRTVDELANGAAKAEIRDLHFTVLQMHKSMAQLTEMLTYQQQQQTLHNQLLLSLRAEQQQMPRRGQTDGILRMLDDFEPKAKKRTELLVDNFSRNITWNPKGLEHLAVDDNWKNMLRALATRHKSAGRSDMIVSGEVNNLTMLVQGGSGTGKTLTAESFAQIVGKPLYCVPCRDIGTDPEDVETYLKIVLHLGKTYDCVLVLEEADVFLEKRTTGDLRENSLASIFLRALEYYNGILIMTSSLRGAFDDAFVSKTHAVVHYDDLTKEFRKTIWCKSLRMIEESGGVGTNMAELEMRLDELAAHEMNGRQIRNALFTARQLSNHRGERLDWRHLRQAMNDAAPNLRCCQGALLDWTHLSQTMKKAAPLLEDYQGAW